MTFNPSNNTFVYINNPYDIDNPRLVIGGLSRLTNAAITALRSCDTVQGQDVQNNTFSECETCTVVSENGHQCSSAGSTPTRRSGNTTPQAEQEDGDFENINSTMTLVSRVSLVSYVPFYAYDASVTEYSGLSLRGAAPPEHLRPSTLRQMFFGQLPVNTSDSVVVWLCKKFANTDVLYIERLQKRMLCAENKCCMQVFVHESHVNDVLALNKRILFDVTGVWFIENEDHQAAVEHHLAGNKGVTLDFVYPHNPKLPSRTIVVEMATSTYVRGKRKQQQHYAPEKYVGQSEGWWYSAGPHQGVYAPRRSGHAMGALPSYQEAAGVGEGIQHE